MPHKDVCKALRVLAEQTSLRSHPEPNDAHAFVKAVKDKELAAKIALHMEDLRKKLSTNGIYLDLYYGCRRPHNTDDNALL